MKDSLGDRMKGYYEDRYRLSLPRRSNIVIRIDGKAFHTYTRGLNKPYDEALMEDMNQTTRYLCENIQGAKLGYVQSDEISIVLTDYDTIDTSGWFDYNLQKMCSIAASLATAHFNFLRMQRYFCGNQDNVAVENDKTIGEHFKPGTNLEDVRDDIASFVNYMPIKHKVALFDARIFVIPEQEEVVNYFVWRQQDATKNGISMAAQSLFSHKALHGMKGNEMQDKMMTEKNVNWNDFPVRFKRGGVVVKREQNWYKLKDKPNVHPRSCSDAQLPNIQKDPNNIIFQRSAWTAIDPPIFTQDRNFILNELPAK